MPPFLQINKFYLNHKKLKITVYTDHSQASLLVVSDVAGYKQSWQAHRTLVIAWHHNLQETSRRR